MVTLDYEHSTSIDEFRTCIAGVLEDNLVHKIKSSVKFSLMFDESTNVSIHQNISTYLFGIDSLFRANAESIFDKVIEMLQVRGISLSSLCGLSTYGAAVMLGHKSGVFLVLLICHFSHIINHLIEIIGA